MAVAPEIEPDHARRLSRSDWWQIANRMRQASKRHQASVLAGGVAFYGFLSMLPALVALVSGYGLLADPEDVRRQVDLLAGGLPEAVQAAVYREMSTLVVRSSRTLSLEATIGLFAAIWAATKGTKALITALSFAFGQQETRGFIRLKLTAFLFTAGAIVFGVLSIGAMIVLPIVMSHLGLSLLAQHLAVWLRWPALALVLLFGLAVTYHYGPARPPGRWRWVTAGSVVAAALWLAGTAVFSWFVSRFASGGKVDGSLGVVITLLTWFLLSAHIFIIGAELNAEIARQRAADGIRVGDEPEPRRREQSRREVDYDAWP
jgi:membrane protein